jgi:hypothetical protein
MIRSYNLSRECELRDNKKYNPYAQRFWWAIYCDNYGLVKKVEARCQDGSIGQAYVKAWQMEIDGDFRTYATILKRFEKSTSCLGVQDWLDKHFDNNLQAWDFRYWKPSRVEIVHRRLWDDNDIQEDPHTLNPLLWIYVAGLMVHYFKNDKNDTSLVLSEQEVLLNKQRALFAK